MTTLVAYQGTDGSAWIGSDQLVTAGDARDCLRPKWRAISSTVAFGWAGSLHVGNVLEQILRGGLRDPGAITEAAREEMIRRGWKTDPNKSDPYFDASAVLCVDRELFELELAMGYASPLFPGEFRAFGSGWRFAAGAWSALSEAIPVRERLDRILRAAISLDIYSGGEPHVVGFLPACVPQRSLADAGAGAPDAPRTVALRGDRGEDPKGETRTR